MASAWDEIGNAMDTIDHAEDEIARQRKVVAESHTILLSILVDSKLVDNYVTINTRKLRRDLDR